MQTREGGRFAKKQKAVLPSDDAATVKGPAAVTIDDDSTAVAVDDESKANSVLKRHFCCDPLLPWRQQSSTQDGSTVIVFFTLSCSGYAGLLSGVTFAGTAGLPHAFLDVLLVSPTGEPIGRGVAKQIDDAITIRKAHCVHCNRAPEKVRSDLNAH